MALQESGEMYLETIYVLSQTSNAVRGIDIADQHRGPYSSLKSVSIVICSM